jgi:penicillin-binding protein 1B
LSNAPRSYTIDHQTWTPHNFKPSALKTVSLREAMVQSLNVAAVDLAMQVGLSRIVDNAQAFEFSTPLAPYPSLALGAFEMIPLELARAYCAFAADGVLPYPLSVREVVDESGAPLERRHLSIQRIMPPEKAYLMTSLLRSVVKEGTARSLTARGIHFPVAGKTGTTNDYRDGWFVGYTPNILALVWVGFDNGRSIRATGSSAALPIWADLMQSIPHHISNDGFRVPAGIIQKPVCLDTGLLANKGACPATRMEVFLAKQLPDGTCHLHRPSNPIQNMFKEVKNFFKKL